MQDRRLMARMKPQDYIRYLSEQSRLKKIQKEREKANEVQGFNTYFSGANANKQNLRKHNTLQERKIRRKPQRRAKGWEIPKPVEVPITPLVHNQTTRRQREPTVINIPWKRAGWGTTVAMHDQTTPRTTRISAGGGIVQAYDHHHVFQTSSNGDSRSSQHATPSSSNQPKAATLGSNEGLMIVGTGRRLGVPVTVDHDAPTPILTRRRFRRVLDPNAYPSSASNREERKPMPDRNEAEVRTPEKVESEEKEDLWSPESADRPNGDVDTTREETSEKLSEGVAPGEGTSLNDATLVEAAPGDGTSPNDVTVIKAAPGEDTSLNDITPIKQREDEPVLAVDDNKSPSERDGEHRDIPRSTTSDGKPPSPAEETPATRLFPPLNSSETGMASVPAHALSAEDDTNAEDKKQPGNDDGEKKDNSIDPIREFSADVPVVSTPPVRRGNGQDFDNYTPPAPLATGVPGAIPSVSPPPQVPPSVSARKAKDDDREEDGNTAKQQITGNDVAASPINDPATVPSAGVADGAGAKEDGANAAPQKLTAPIIVKSSLEMFLEHKRRIAPPPLDIPRVSNSMSYGGSGWLSDHATPMILPGAGKKGDYNRKTMARRPAAVNDQDNEEGEDPHVVTAANNHAGRGPIDAAYLRQLRHTPESNLLDIFANQHLGGLRSGNKSTASHLATPPDHHQSFQSSGISFDATGGQNPMLMPTPRLNIGLPANKSGQPTPATAAAKVTAPSDAAAMERPSSQRKLATIRAKRSTSDGVNRQRQPQKRAPPASSSRSADQVASIIASKVRQMPNETARSLLGLVTNLEAKTGEQPFHRWLRSYAATIAGHDHGVVGAGEEEEGAESKLGKRASAPEAKINMMKISGETRATKERAAPILSSVTAPIGQRHPQNNNQQQQHHHQNNQHQHQQPALHFGTAAAFTTTPTANTAAAAAPPLQSSSSLPPQNTIVKPSEDSNRIVSRPPSSSSTQSSSFPSPLAQDEEAGETAVERHLRKVHGIKSFQIKGNPFGAERKVVTIQLTAFSSWGDPDVIGLTELKVLDGSEKEIPLAPGNIHVRYAHCNRAGLAKLFNRKMNTTNSRHMWEAPLPVSLRAGAIVELLISIAVKFNPRVLRLWNYNSNERVIWSNGKQSTGLARGMKDVTVSVNGDLSWRGVLPMACGQRGVPYGFDIGLLENRVVSSKEEDDTGQILSKSTDNEETPTKNDFGALPRTRRPASLPLQNGGDERDRFVTAKVGHRNGQPQPQQQQLQAWDLPGPRKKENKPAIPIRPVSMLGKRITLVIEENWGDPHYVGLTGIQVLGPNLERIDDSALGAANNQHGMLQLHAFPRDMNVIPGYSGDTRTLDKLLDGVNCTNDDNHMWLAPKLKREKKDNRQPTEQQSSKAARTQFLQILLPKEHLIGGLRIWNYNKSEKDARRGIKRCRIILDKVDISPESGQIFHKAPGTVDYDFSQFIPLKPRAELA